MVKRHTTLYVNDSKPLNLCGKTIGFELLMDSFAIPFEIEPTIGEHDFNTCDGCQESLNDLTTKLRNKFNGDSQKLGFPFCCTQHSNLVKLNEFDRKDFLSVPEIVAKKIIYTRQHIINNHESEDWYKIITEYIEWTVESFGAFPRGCGESLYLSDYFSCIKSNLQRSEDVENNKKKRLLEYLDLYQKPNQKPKTDLNILLGIYHQWLNIFPFNLNSYFGNLKEHFSKSFPLINGEPVINKYSGITEIQMHTKSSLFEVLINITDSLLKKVNALTLYNNGHLINANKIRLELIIEAREHQLKCGYKNDSPNEEQRYRKMIKKWFEDEKKFMQEITPLFSNKSIETFRKPEEINQQNNISNPKDEDAMNRNTLSLIKNGVYSQNFPNEMEGGFEYNASNSSYRFIEAINDLHNLKYLERERTLENTPIRAIGIIAYVTRNYGVSAVDIYSTYFNTLQKQYIDEENKKPGAFKRNLKSEFFSKHIEEEKQKIEISKNIFEFVSETEKNELIEFSNNYFEYISISQNTTPESISNTDQKDNDVEKKCEYNLTLSHIALICIYQGILINTQNAENLITEHGGKGKTSKLLEKYSIFLNRENRISVKKANEYSNRPELARIKLLNEVIIYLENKGKDAAKPKSELNEIEEYF